MTAAAGLVNFDSDEESDEKIVSPDPSKDRYKYEDHHSHTRLIMHPKTEHKCTLIWLQHFDDCKKHKNELFEFVRNANLPDGCKVIIPNPPISKTPIRGKPRTCFYETDVFNEPQTENPCHFFFRENYRQDHIQTSVKVV